MHLCSLPFYHKYPKYKCAVSNCRPVHKIVERISCDEFTGSTVAQNKGFFLCHLKCRGKRAVKDRLAVLTKFLLS